jgi:glycine/D-amino acid oxidase-like deaminating enzyme
MPRERADAAVIGAGCIGASIARYLAGRGARGVSVPDGRVGLDLTLLRPERSCQDAAPVEADVI